MDKKKLFYGTPLSRSLENDHHDDVQSSERNRRANIFNKMQTVRDNQGRQRFHGAFTGGFSAGYFNTVDSVEGFKPKQFISRRGVARDGNRFNHKPEDYMDEEDISEFGIAPKKIRVTNMYNRNEVARDSTDVFMSSFVLPKTKSIGETILQQINSNFNNKRCPAIDNLQSVIYTQKNNYHGLGYKPLKTHSDVPVIPSQSNPLIATLGGGKRLKISGEAFGEGFAEENEDLIVENNTYGYDNISNYEFDKKKSKYNHINVKFNNKRIYYDKHSLKGFVQCTDMDAIKIFEHIPNYYPLPDIPASWKMPARTKAELPSKTTSNIEINLDLIPRASTSGILDKKFTHAVDLLKSHDIETRAGLVSYSDLKAVGTTMQDVADVKSKEVDMPSISREKYEWRPCSLLCKHFNVPNPFPDNLFCGVKNSQQVQHDTTTLSNEVELNNSIDIQAPMDIKRSIYNMTFQHDSATLLQQQSHNLEVEEDYYDDEEEPQVVEIIEENIRDTEVVQHYDEDQEIVVIPAVKPEPELIILCSSSCSSSRSSSPSRTTFKQDKKETLDTNSDESLDYGPPLPPTLRTLIDSDHKHSNKSSDTSRRKSKIRIKR